VAKTAEGERARIDGRDARTREKGQRDRESKDRLFSPPRRTSGGGTRSPRRCPGERAAAF